MSTHNIGFYEDLTEIILKLSSNIIKYAPYFFFCEFASTVDLDGMVSTVSSVLSSNLWIFDMIQCEQKVLFKFCRRNFDICFLRAVRVKIFSFPTA